MWRLITALIGKENHSELQVDQATCAGAAGTCLPTSTEERGGLGSLAIKLPSHTYNWNLSADSF